MPLYEQEAARIDESAIREQFMAVVYDELTSDGTNDRANRIIGAFDDAQTAIIDRLAAERPEVVRCGECGNRGRTSCPMRHEESYVTWAEDNSFCSYGKRARMDAGKREG